MELICWCQGLDWDKVIFEYPDQARVYAMHNCELDSQNTKKEEGEATK